MSQNDSERVLCSQLRNRYFLLRHGQSEANRWGLIASSPGVAVSQFGLTQTGREQISRSIDQHRERLAAIDRIFTSDFRRARETAEIVASVLRAPVEEAVQLRERDFGQWDGQPDDHYRTVWSADAEDPTHQQWGVESVAAVARRMSLFIGTVDQSGFQQSYLIVSHGDPLQILITTASGRDLRLHRQLEPLTTAELRPLC
jgi:probable phosphoglycerate mutase